MSKAMERFVKARMTLILHQPFFGSLALRLKPVEMPSISTCATEGKHLFFNPAYFDSLSDAELRFEICHEVKHCAMGHPWRRGHREHERWNIACDLTIDPIINAASRNVKGTVVMSPPPLARLNHPFENMAAEDVYEKLPKDAGGKARGESQDQGGAAQPGGGDMKPHGEVLDADPRTATTDQQDWKRATIQAAKMAKAHGNLPASIERLIEELKQPTVNWRATLRRFVQQLARLDYSWARPSSRYASMGLYLPTIQSEHMPPIVVVFDTSGSIGGPELASFDAELRAIVAELQPEETHLVFCDAAVDEESCVALSPFDPITYRPTGGGGTSFIPAFEWVERQGIEPACLIYLTDCMGAYPTEAPEYPVIWCSTLKNPGRYHPPFGEFICMGGER